MPQQTSQPDGIPGPRAGMGESAYDETADRGNPKMTVA
jgi:hypothetical protein